MISQSDFEEMSLYISMSAAKIHKLEDDSHKLLNKVLDREDDLQIYRDFFTKNARNLRLEINQIQNSMDAANVQIAQLISMLKSVVRIDKFNELKESIDELKFEFYLDDNEVRDLVDQHNRVNSLPARFSRL